MSGSLTVIGGHTGSSLTGIVTIPSSQPTLLLSSLQTTLTDLSNSVLAGTEGLLNPSIVGSSSGTFGSDGPIPTILDITNFGTNPGSSVPGAPPASISITLGADINVLAVEAPGAETISGPVGGSTGLLAIFGSNSSVNFTDDGSGTVVASSYNFIDVGGAPNPSSAWSVFGSTTGNDTINTTSYSTFIQTAGSVTGGGPSNVIGLNSDFATVVAGGNNDLVASYTGSDVISITGGADVLIQGGADTVYAAAGATSASAFFIGTSNGGTLDFINQSSVAGSVTGGAFGSSGSVTVFGGTAGGFYQGGISGNNSLVGGTGTGSTTLVGAGDNNFLSVQGSGSNALFAGAGDASLYASSSTKDNSFSGGQGTDVISTAGSGTQSFYVGTLGSETMTGSSVAGATNNYYFQQTSLQGGGTDVITNFNAATDNGYINAGLAASVGGVTITSLSQSVIDGKESTTLSLSDSTTIKLIGTTFTVQQQASITGGTHF